MARVAVWAEKSRKLGNRWEETKDWTAKRTQQWKEEKESDKYQRGNCAHASAQTQFRSRQERGII